MTRRNWLVMGGWVGLVSLYLLPIWLFSYFPSQDGPSHLYNAHIFAEYWNTSYVYSQYFVINWSVFPNWFSHIILVLLLKVFPPMWAEKIFLSGYILFFLGSMRYFFRAVQPGSSCTTATLLSFVFVYHFFFQMGFYNFSLGVAASFLCLGYWWKHKEQQGLQRLVVLHIALSILFFIHLFAFVLAVASLLFLSFAYFFRQPKRWLEMWMGLLPTGIWVLLYLPRSEFASRSAFANISTWLNWNTFWSRLDRVLFETVASLHEKQVWIANTVGILIGISLLLSFHQVWKQHRNPAEITRQELPNTTHSEGKSWIFLCLAILFFLMYMGLPGTVGSMVWLDSRFTIFFWLCLLALIRIPAGMIQNILHIAIVFLLVGHIALFTYLCSWLNQGMQHYMSVLPKIERNKRLIPLVYSASLPSTKNKSKNKLPRATSELWTLAGFRIQPYLHLISYVSIATGAINLGNYEAVLDYFPVSFRPSLLNKASRARDIRNRGKAWIGLVYERPDWLNWSVVHELVDYVVVWGFPKELKVRASLMKFYDPIHVRDPLFVFRKKTTIPK